MVVETAVGMAVAVMAVETTAVGTAVETAAVETMTVGTTALGAERMAEAAAEGTTTTITTRRLKTRARTGWKSCTGMECTLPCHNLIASALVHHLVFFFLL